jgi:hypothetical protein
MPASSYLSGGDLATYGVPNATAAQVTQASVFLDAYLKRMEGLVWTPDSQGNPCCMASPDPELTFNLVGSIAPGQNVAAQLSGPQSALQAGETLVIDRTDSAKIEALQVVSNLNGQVVFANVMNAHSNGAQLGSGLLISEQRYMPKNRPIVFVGRTPLVRIVSGIGRYAYPRRGDQYGSSTDDFNLLATYTQFGGPPQWEIFNTQQNTGFDPRTGQVWIPAGIMLAYYTEVRLQYVAGFAASALPSAVKLVCARLVKAIINDPGLGAAKSYRAGDTAVERFAATLIDEDSANLLRPFRINGVV